MANAALLAGSAAALSIAANLSGVWNLDLWMFGRFKLAIAMSSEVSPKLVLDVSEEEELYPPHLFLSL